MVNKLKAKFIGECVLVEEGNLSRELYDKSRFGESNGRKQFQYSLVEGLFLMEKGKINVYDFRNKKLNYEGYFKKAKKIEPNFYVRYCVYKDMRTRGYIIKTALKFGADFRVYDRGVKPGEDHAKWVLYPVHETEVLTWYEFSAKNRVAHSTKKNLLLGVVDDEGDVTYYTVSWTKP